MARHRLFGKVYCIRRVVKGQILTCSRNGPRPQRHVEAGYSRFVRIIPNFYLSIHSHGTHRVWISSDNVKAVAEKGFKLVHAASDYFYLVSRSPDFVINYLLYYLGLQDCGGGGWVGSNPDG